MSNSLSEYEDYIDNFNRTTDGAGSHKDKDRFSSLDIMTMFKERGDVSKSDAARMVLDYADDARDSGSSLGGGSERKLKELRGYLKDEKPEEDNSLQTDQPPEFAHSPKVAHAKARLAQYKDDVLSGKTGTDLFGGTASQDASDSFLERYKLKLGKQDDNGNYYEPE